LLNVVAPLTPSVPPILVLPLDPTTVNALVLTAIALPVVEPIVIPLEVPSGVYGDYSRTATPVAVNALPDTGFMLSVPVIVSPDLRTLSDAAPVILPVPEILPDTLPVTLPIKLAVIMLAEKFPEPLRTTIEPGVPVLDIVANLY